MNHRLKGLNAAQREAVTTLQGPVLVLAGAGTGKTKVITHRIAHLVDSGVPSGQILAVTFTNKAAREMKERTLALLGREENGSGQFFAGTFHSFCVRVLREHIGLLGYKRNFSICAESDAADLVKGALRDSGIHASSKEVNRTRGLFSLAKNRGVEAGQISREAGVARAFRRYQAELKARNAVDFDDLLLLVLELLREHGEVREQLRRRHRYLLVDEYQDTNGPQFEIVRRLASDRLDVCVVGDDDQSIYSWRGAESRHILEFERHFPGTKVVKLEQNYRCTPTILEAANRVIRNNARRHGKVLWADGPPGEKVRVVEAAADTDEVDWVVHDLLEAREAGLRWEEAAVLYRANHLSRGFEQGLRRARIPYRVVGGQEFFERREVKDLLAYLQVMLNPDDDASLLRIVNVPARGIGAATVQKVLELSRQKGRSVWAEIGAEEHGLGLRAEAALASFRGLVEKHAPAFRGAGPWSAAWTRFVEDLDYDGELRRVSKDMEELQNRRENMQEVAAALAQHEGGKNGGLADFVDRMLLRDREEEQDQEKDDGFGVSLMTLHAAKGLEFRRVYLVGLEEGVLPHDRVKLEGNVDEERRLFYVGITRAKERLSLSYCAQRMRYQQMEPRHPSSFLRELPEEVVERVSAAESKRELAPEEVSAHFAALRERLGKG